MSSAVIVGFKRSPFTIAKKGELSTFRPEDILAQVVNALVKDTGINKKDIEDIIVGCAYPEGEQGYNIAKIITFMTNMPEHVAGMTVNRWCGSSMQAIHNAAGSIAMNAGNVFICCGIESMSKVPINGLNYSPHPKLKESNPNVYLSMGDTVLRCNRTLYGWIRNSESISFWGRRGGPWVFQLFIAGGPPCPSCWKRTNCCRVEEKRLATAGYFWVCLFFPAPVDGLVKPG